LRRVASSLRASPAAKSCSLNSPPIQLTTAPAVMAFAAGSAEILLPIFLALGLATRFAALGLLVIALVVQLSVPDGRCM
jgi:uncharacterized membrane protein YphA (DoxX/SURF4 family)